MLLVQALLKSLLLLLVGMRIEEKSSILIKLEAHWTLDKHYYIYWAFQKFHMEWERVYLLY